MTSPQDSEPWWKEAVVYQIYPRSFNDSDGDGVGDLPGILERLSYLDDLGVDAVWLNPIYPSPFADGGYDVRDYRGVHEDFGTMEDFQRLLEGLHGRGIRLIMDLVVNHTSDEHPWFRRALENPAGPYRDYYIWRPGEPGNPPNNWESAFGGPAWTYHEASGEYYLHLFHEKQPDLNWANPRVRHEVYEMMQWWLEKGIDGFRMDVINLLSKPEALPDGNPELPWVGVEHFTNGPDLTDYFREMNQEVLSGRDVMTVGECVAAGVEEANRYVRPQGPLSMVFHFDHVMLDFDLEAGWWSIRDWDLVELKQVFTRWQTRLKGWNSLYFGNHDGPRMVSRFGNDDEHREASAKLLATFLLTMPGTSFLYQGDEIGMTNYPFESLEEFRDPQTIGRVREALERGEIDSFRTVRDVVRARSRDNARTPMQWTDGPAAGFTGGDPWLAVNPNHRTINVEANRRDPDSILHYYRRLIDLRRQRPVLGSGEYELYLPEHNALYVYTLSGDDERVLVVLNWSDSRTVFEPPDDLAMAEAEVLIANRKLPDDEGETVTLNPWEARVYRLDV